MKTDIISLHPDSTAISLTPETDTEEQIISKILQSFIKLGFAASYDGKSLNFISSPPPTPPIEETEPGQALEPTESEHVQQG
jgi:hypothetical protein